MKTHRMKRVLASLLSILMMFGTCTGYACAEVATEVNRMEAKASVEPESEELQPDGDAAPGTIGMMNPYLDGQSMTIYKNESDSGHQQPQIIYGTFTQNGQAVTRALYCIDFAKSLRGGSGFAEQAEYSRLNESQTKAISYVLGKTRILDAPRNSEGGFDNTGNLIGWQEYVATQLLIWYYIDQYYTAGSCEGIGWYGVEKACADGYANLEYVTMVKNYVDSIYTVPSFSAGNTENSVLRTVSVPTYELKYQAETGLYQTTLTDENGVLSRFDFSSENGITYTKSGDTLNITSDHAITKSDSLIASSSYQPDIGTVICVVTADDGQQPLLRCDGADKGSPVQAYLSVYTEDIHGYAELTKTDATTGKKIAGAEYGIYTDKACTNQIDTMTTDKNGYAKSGELEAGTYYVKETYAPPGYVKSDEVHTLTL